MADYREIVKNEWENFAKKEHYPNIMLLGATGCGKSSLINTVFGENVAYVSNTGRGTSEFKVYHGKDTGRTVNLIDSMGYEMGSADSLNQYIAELRKWMDAHRNTEDSVHLVWYCVMCNNTRFQEFDEKVLKAVMSEPTLRNKVVVVVTKCDQDNEDGSKANAIRQQAHKLVSPSLEVLEVSTDENLKLDLEKLVEWSSEHIDDEEIRRMFIASQMVSLKQKRKTAALIVSGAVAAAAATGAIPIPGSDAPILTAEQVAMSAAIISCYGMNMAKGVVTTLVGNVLVSNLGKTLVGSILKLIPGIGTVAGAVVNGSVAAAITGALGAAISEICYGCCKRIAKGEEINLVDELDSDKIKGVMSAFLKENGKKSPKEISKTIEVDAEEK